MEKDVSIQNLSGLRPTMNEGGQLIIASTGDFTKPDTFWKKRKRKWLSDKTISLLKVTEIKDNSGYEHDFIGTVNGEVIGRAELLIDKVKNEAEFRIHLVPEWQNKRYGSELTKVAVERGLTYLNRIWLGFEEGNERARRIYEWVGFKYTLHRMEIKR